MNSQNILDVFRPALRLLTFRLSRDEFLALDHRHLIFGLMASWLVGVGRYWDHPSASILQYLGLGSVIYTICLSAFLWLLLWPLRPKDWSYTRVLTFVALTSPPAILYAIPVERFMTMEAARMANVWFLAAVALWRLALLVFFLRRVARFRIPTTILATLLPMAVIIGTLTALNLEQAVFRIMAGLPEPSSPEATSGDLAYAILFFLTALSVWVVPILLLWYVGAAAVGYSAMRKEKEAVPSEAPASDDPGSG